MVPSYIGCSMDSSIAKMIAQLDPIMLEQILDRYVRREIGLAKSAALLGIHLMDFQYIAGSRGIELALTPDDLQSDVETLRRLGQFRES